MINVDSDNIFNRVILNNDSLVYLERKMICDDIITLSRWINDFSHINKWQNKSISYEDLLYKTKDRDLVWVLKQTHIAYAVHFFYSCSK
ncbi:MAG: hypothetical protein ACOCVF_04255 [bacterium]